MCDERQRGTAVFKLRSPRVAVLYGYTYGAPGLRLPVDRQPSAQLRIRRRTDDFYPARRPVGVVWSDTPPIRGGHWPTLCVPDPDDPANIAIATAYRFGRAHEGQDDKLKRSFRAFCTYTINRYFPVCGAQDRHSFEQWLGHQTSGAAAAVRYKRNYRERGELNSSCNEARAFIKREGYNEQKPPRAIYTMSEEIKDLYGPIFDAVESQLAAMPFFVKGLDDPKRVNLLSNRFGGEPVVAFDASSMESSHRDGNAAVVAHAYVRSLGGILHHSDLRDVLHDSLTGLRRVSHRDMDFEITDGLLSGARHTSIANGVLNVLAHMFVRDVISYPDSTHRARARRMAPEFDHNTCTIVAEGDDLAAGIPKHVTDVEDYKLSMAALYKQLGIAAKLTHGNIENVGFCSLYWAGATPMRDHATVLAKAFFIPTSHSSRKPAAIKQYVRERALCLANAMGGCPVISACAYAQLERTSGIRVDGSTLDSYQRSAFDRVKKDIWKNEPPVTMQSRAAYEDLFGMSISDQILYERLFRRWGSGEKVEFPVHERWSKMIDNTAEYTNGHPADCVNPMVEKLRKCKLGVWCVFNTGEKIMKQKKQIIYAVVPSEFAS